MDRRSFITEAGLAGILAASSAPAIAQTGGAEVRWRCISSFPKSLDALFAAGESIAKRVAALTHNRFHIQYFAPNEIVPSVDSLEATSKGTVDCVHTMAHYYVNKDPTFGFGGAAPFGLNSRQQAAWMYHGGGLDLMREFYRNFGVVSFPAGNTGAQMGGWFRREIRSLADLKGLKMRIGGHGGEVMKRFGLVPQQLELTEVYAALERGTTDAAECIGPYDDERLGLAKIVKFYYYPSWWKAGSQVDLMVNLSAWEALPADYKIALEASCRESSLNMVAAYEALNSQALRRLVAAGTQLRQFPRDLMEACWYETHEFYGEIASKNLEFQRVYTPWRKFRDDQLRWSSITETRLSNFMEQMAARPPSMAKSK